jgi:hypothetical protein
LKLSVRPAPLSSVKPVVGLPGAPMTRVDVPVTVSGEAGPLAPAP